MCCTTTALNMRLHSDYYKYTTQLAFMQHLILLCAKIVKFKRYIDQ
jgi:hypothetical protein